MSDQDKYKDTIFLPRTDFPMRGELPKREPEILKKWQEMDLHARLRKDAAAREKWVLHDGPPYANGDIHMGHALNKILKDVINRSFQSLGYNAPYVPGWDCHGLPIEWKIEEKYRAEGRNKDDVNILDFRAECRAFAQKWVDTQSKQFQRLGVTGDWKTPYLTMTKRAEAQIVREIHKFLMNGGLYKGVKPVMWSVVEKTALAEAEVEYKEHKSITVWVKFPVVKTNNPALNGASVVIWTTTPWTLPSNRALAYGEKIKYGIYRVDAPSLPTLPPTSGGEGKGGGDVSARAKPGERFIVALSLADSIRQTAKIDSWTLEQEITGADVTGTICAHPLRGQGYDDDVPMLAGDFVTEDTGTGFVHIAPGHGIDDFNLIYDYNNSLLRAGTLEEIFDDSWQEKQIKITDNVSDDGKFREHVPLFANKEVYTQKGEIGDGNFAVLKALDEASNLLAKGSLRHEYPHSWRSKAPLIFRTTPQWFIALDVPEIIQKVDNNNPGILGKNLRQKTLNAIKDTNWYPPKGQTRITAMIENRPDWCISRQRTWGVPIALFVNKANNEPLEDEAVLKHIADTFEAEGSDAWWSHDAKFFLGDKYNPDDYDQVFDIVDVWFESGSTHAFVLGDTKTWPVFDGVKKADLYLEGSDQHRGWFHSSLLESCGTRGEAPFKTVLTHGFVLDEKGYKMSKSLGNVVDPLEMIDVHGADIVRLWAMLSDYSEDIRISKDTIKLTGDLYRRIRNTFRYLLGALDGFSAAERLPPSEYKNMPELEQLALHWLKDMDQTVQSCIAAYDFSRLIHTLHHFCTNELSAFYFDVRKDRLYCDRPDLFERRAARTVMAEIFNCLTAWLAPYLCYTAEEAWEHRPRGVFGDAESVHLRQFPTLPADWENPALAGKWQQVMAIRRVVLGALEPKRAEKIIGSSLEAHPVLYLDQSIANVDFSEICITSQITVKTGTEAPADSFRLPDVAGVAVVFGRAEGQKCQRCWKTLPDIGADPDYPDLSARDADAVRWYMKDRNT